MSRDFRHKVSGRERQSERDLSGSHELVTVSRRYGQVWFGDTASANKLQEREQPGSGLISGVTHTGTCDI